MKVLFVDDDPELQEAMRLIFLLRWPDANLIVAGNGSEGLHLALRETPTSWCWIYRCPT